MDYTDRYFLCDCNKYLKIGPITKPLPDDFQYCEGTCDISGTLDERNTFTYEEIMKDNHREIPDDYNFIIRLIIQQKVYAKTIKPYFTKIS